MDIVVKSRHCEISDGFRKHVQEKLAKVDKWDQKVIRIDVELSKEHNPRLADVCERIEITVRSRGPVVRAEAAADDPYAALDQAWTRIEGRLRRAADRRRVHHGAKTPVSVASATGALAAQDSQGSAAVAGLADGADPYDVGDAPVQLISREKEHTATPMSMDQALHEMELVGHDFFLFVDEASGRPSVVYRRRGYDYGVIRLAPDGAAATA